MDCAFLDASVLYPASLRNLLMRLTLNGLFQARWSNDVHDEWIRSLIKNRPDLSIASLHRVRDAMNEHAEECIVSGYESLIDQLHLPDPNDHHVLAAAIVGGANLIVTHNLKDFPAASLLPHGIVATHPDEFLHSLLEETPVSFLDALRDQQTSLNRPPVSMMELLTLFERIGLNRTVDRLMKQLGL